jgi:SHS2 domain-containing protein
VAREPRGHELIEHTADVGLRVWAPTIDELFAEAAIGLVDVMGAAPGPTAKREDIDVDAPDIDGLLVDWLSEILFLFEAREIAPAEVRVHVADDGKSLRAWIEGPSTDEFIDHGPAVKAVTYHGLEVKRLEAGCEATVYLDV